MFYVYASECKPPHTCIHFQLNLFEIRQMEKLIIPAAENNPQRFATIQEVCAKLQAAQKTSYDVVRG
jgi:hypothetical protein